MNKVELMGRLTRDPDIKYSQGENPTCIARYTLAVDRRYKKDGGQQADFPTCVAFGKTAEFVEKYLHKGTKVAVVGRLTTGSYTNKEGQKVYTTEVTVEEHHFAESRNSVQQSSEIYQRQPEPNSQQAITNGMPPIDAAPDLPPPDPDGFTEIPDIDDLPF